MARHPRRVFDKLWVRLTDMRVRGLVLTVAASPDATGGGENKQDESFVLPYVALIER
jgi:hypothetical protein